MLSSLSCREDVPSERSVLLKRLQANNKYMKQREEEAAAHRDAARADAEHVEKKMRHQEETILLLQQQLEVVQDQHHALKTDLLSLTTDKMIYATHIKMLEEENNWLRKDVDELNQDNMQIDDLKVENKELKRQLMEAEERVKNLQDQLDNMQQQLKQRPLIKPTTLDEDLFFFMKNLPGGEEEKQEQPPSQRKLQPTIHLNRTENELLYEMSSPERKKEIQDIVFGIKALKGRPSRDFFHAMRNKATLALRRQYEAQIETGVFSEEVRQYMNTHDFAIVYGALSTYQTTFDKMQPLQKKAVSLILRDGWGVRNLTFQTRQAWNSIDESMREFVLNEADRLHAPATAQIYL
jgi:hypothetical protein